MWFMSHSQVFYIPDGCPSFCSQFKISPTPDLPLLSLASIPLIAYSLLFLTPLTMQLVKRQALQPQYFGLSHPVSLVLSYVLGTIAFKQVPSWTDVFVASLLYVGKFVQRYECRWWMFTLNFQACIQRASKSSQLRLVHQAQGLLNLT